MMIDGYTLICEGSFEIIDPDKFEDVVADLQEELGSEVYYALVRTNEDETTEVIDWSWLKCFHRRR